MEANHKRVERHAGARDVETAVALFGGGSNWVKSLWFTKWGCHQVRSDRGVEKHSLKDGSAHLGYPDNVRIATQIASTSDTSLRSCLRSYACWQGCSCMAGRNAIHGLPSGPRAMYAIARTSFLEVTAITGGSSIASLLSTDYIPCQPRLSIWDNEACLKIWWLVVAYLDGSLSGGLC